VAADRTFPVAGEGTGKSMRFEKEISANAKVHQQVEEAALPRGREKISKKTWSGYKRERGFPEKKDGAEWVKATCRKYQREKKRRKDREDRLPNRVQTKTGPGPTVEEQPHKKKPIRPRVEEKGGGPSKTVEE